MPLNTQQIREHSPSHRIHYYPSVGSTMTEAVRLAAEGAPLGTVVLADEQTAGVGRLGRTWLSESGLGIYCSVLLNLTLEPAAIPVASLAVGLATAEAIEKTTDLSCDLRWPNDVLIRGRKAAGVLAQFSERHVIAGIGINVNQLSMPDGLRTPATSLRIESGGRSQSREQIAATLLQSLDAFCSLLQTDGPSAVRRAFTAASSYATGRRVIAEETGLRGVTAGLDEQGFLLLRTKGGALERIYSGGVRPDEGAVP